MIQAWRIVPTTRAKHAFDGEGARLYGGRWNSPGLPLVYTAGSRALAALEILVHLQPTDTPPAYARIEVVFPEDLVQTIPPELFGQEDLGPAVQPDTQNAGDAWIRAMSSPVLSVPSAIIPEEPNYLLNPRHPRFPEITRQTPEIWCLDPRLVNM